jgi:beta-glucosidase
MSNQSPLPYLNPHLSNEARAEDLLARMNLEEKVAQLSAAWLAEVREEAEFSIEKAGKRVPNGIGQITRQAGGAPLTPEQAAQVTAQLQNFLVSNTRLGIPAMIHDECCSGYMARGATLFPQAIGLASTWDPDLIEEMTKAIRQQMRAAGVHHGLAPVLDVTRDPRWGRVEETYGEDPYLAARIGTSYVRGLQGEDLRTGIAATGKHFAAHGMPEGGLNWARVQVSWREFREVYLLPFEAAVKEAGLATMMNAYHELDGVPCGCSRELLTDVLRDEWGFTGIVASDYGTLPNLVDYHFVAANKMEAAAMALEAGLDLELPGTDCYGAPLLEALQTGRLKQDVLDEAVRRMVRMKFRLGLFENPIADPALTVDAYDGPESRALSRKLAQESLILLKNDGQILPLQPGLKTLAVIGPNADAIRHMAGDYSYASMADLIEGSPQPPETTRFPNKLPPMDSILEAIRKVVGGAMAVRYSKGCEITGHDRSGFAEAVELARSADVVVLVAGGRSGQLAACTCGECRDRASLGLLGAQEALADALLNTGTPMVLVLVDGRPAAIPALAERIPAILEAWLPGEEGGGAVAEALFGQINPGGRLPISFPRTVGQVPVFYGHRPSSGRSYPYNDYVDESAKPWFAFGHGLSYTRFDYDDLQVTPSQVPPQGEVTISLNVRNTGERAGDEVVQLYLHDVLASVTRPVKELKGFRRVRLEAGQSSRVTFTLNAGLMGFYDLWRRYGVEPGVIEVMVGSASDDIRLTGQFEITGEFTPIARKVFFSGSAAQPH